MDPAIFLDRDGCIIENKASYVRSWSDVTIYPQALQALQRIRKSQYKIFIITNQSAIGRGIISQAAAESINQRLVAEIESAGGRIDRVLTCPHTNEDDCACRKPKPGMIFEAAAQFTLDLKHSILLGDALSDIIAGQAAGIGQNVLVLTGRGHAQAKLPQAKQIPRFLVYENLSTALFDLIAL
ncbi:MAG: HAD family hydrolase [Chloroflexota bacterium]|nr:MAG: HAD family hydrolase [Chloroflexota bacterium]